MSSILIIDNQKKEFESIERILLRLPGRPSDIKIFPNHKPTQDCIGFSKLLDLCSIILGNRYERDYREEASARLMEYIEQIYPRFVILDHKLAAGDDGGDGIDLFEEIVKKTEQRGQVIKFIFLSKSVKSEEIDQRIEDKARELRLPNYLVPSWVEKALYDIANLEMNPLKEEAVFNSQLKYYAENLSPLLKFELIDKIRLMFLCESDRFKEALNDHDYSVIEDCLSEQNADNPDKRKALYRKLCDICDSSDLSNLIDQGLLNEVKNASMTGYI